MNKNVVLQKKIKDNRALLDKYQYEFSIMIFKFNSKFCKKNNKEYLIDKQMSELLAGNSPVSIEQLLKTEHIMAIKEYDEWINEIKKS